MEVGGHERDKDTHEFSPTPDTVVMSLRFRVATAKRCQ